MSNESEEIKLGKLYLIKTMVQDLIKLLGPETTVQSAKDMFPLIRMIDALIDIYGEHATLAEVENSEALADLQEERNLKIAQKVIKLPEGKPATILNVMHTLINMGFPDLSIKEFREHYLTSSNGVPDFITTRPLKLIEDLVIKHGQAASVREVYYREIEDF